MAAFNGVDFLRFDDLLTEEEKTIRQAVRDWVEEKFLPLIEHHYEAATFPAEIIPQIAELGLLGANLPVEYGCAGIGDVAYGLAMQELERGDSGLRSFVSVQARSSCSPSSPTAPRSSARTGCRSSPAARRSAASA